MSKLTKLNKVQSEEALRFHLGVCYDVCHAAVEFENPNESINILKNQGIRIPKLQLSSAVKIKKIDKNTHEFLKPLNEPVYMHQVVQKDNNDVLSQPDVIRALFSGANSLMVMKKKRKLSVCCFYVFYWLVWFFVCVVFCLFLL